MSYGRKWIFYSTVFAVFSDGLVLIVGNLSLYLFYPLLLLNLIILTCAGWLWISPKLIWFLSYLLLSGISGILLGTGSAVGFLKAFIGIVPNALYYSAFMRFMDFDVRRCFAVYAKLAFYVALYGFAYLPFQTVPVGRLRSVFLEPGAFCVVCLPAAFYYADQWQRERRHGWRCVALIVALLLTSSSMGYMGLLFGMFLFGLRYKRLRIVAPAVVLVVGMLIYNASSLFQVRFDDSVQSALTGDVAEVNESTFGLMVNLFVTQKAFAERPFFGGGLGSHVVAHARFFDDVPGTINTFGEDELRNLGQWDASSLLLRIVSELGLFGLAYSFWFLWHYWPRNASPEERCIAMAILCYVFVKFLRSGVYFDPEEFFFFSIYTVNGIVAQSRFLPGTVAVTHPTSLLADA